MSNFNSDVNTAMAQMSLSHDESFVSSIGDLTFDQTIQSNDTADTSFGGESFLDFYEISKSAESASAFCDAVRIDHFRKRTDKEEIEFLEMLASLSLEDQLTLTANSRHVGDQELHQQLKFQFDCGKSMEHGATSVFNCALTDELAPVIGMKITFALGTDKRGHQTVMANHIESHWDRDSIVSSVGTIHTFDFAGYDLQMLLVSQHLVVGDVIEIKEKADGVIEFEVTWTASLGDCYRSF